MAAPDEEFRVKSLTWHGRDTYMLMQGDNGPCPLLALCNVLLLRNSIALPRPGAPNVAQSELTALLAEYMLESNPVTEASPPDLAANLTDAMALFPKLGRGLDVNVRFDAVDGLEYSEDLLIFDLLRVRLLHGWLVDPQDTATAAAVGSRSYNQLVERIIEIQSLTQANAAAEPDAPPPPPPEAAAPCPGADPFPAADPFPVAGGAAAAAEAPQGTDTDCSEDEEMRQAMQLSLGLASPPPSPPPSAAAADPFPSPAQPALRRSDSMAVREALLLTEWLNGSASQLSYHGLVQLHASLAEAELAVFFRNNHFATITKHGGELYLLATDVGFAREPLVVWERRAQRRPCRPDSAQRAEPCSRGQPTAAAARVGSTRSTATRRSARASSSASRSRSPPPPPRRRPPPQSPPTSPRRRRARRRAWAQRRTRRPTWLWRSSCSGRSRSRRS